MQTENKLGLSQISPARALFFIGGGLIMVSICVEILALIADDSWLYGLMGIFSLDYSANLGRWYLTILLAGTGACACALGLIRRSSGDVSLHWFLVSGAAVVAALFIFSNVSDTLYIFYHRVSQPSLIENMLMFAPQAAFFMLVGTAIVAGLTIRLIIELHRSPHRFGVHNYALLALGIALLMIGYYLADRSMVKGIERWFHSWGPHGETIDFLAEMVPYSLKLVGASIGLSCLFNRLREVMPEAHINIAPARQTR